MIRVPSKRSEPDFSSARSGGCDAIVVVECVYVQLAECVSVSHNGSRCGNTSGSRTIDGWGTFLDWQRNGLTPRCEGELLRLAVAVPCQFTWLNIPDLKWSRIGVLVWYSTCYSPITVNTCILCTHELVSSPNFDPRKQVIVDMALQHTLVIVGEMHSHEALKVEYCEAGACAIASTLELSTGAWRVQCFVAQIWPIRNCFVGAESIRIFKKYSVWVKLPELQVRLETCSDIKCRNKKVVGISIIYKNSFLEVRSRRV